MGKNTIFRAFLIIMAMMILLNGIVSAEDTKVADVEFVITESGDFVNLDMSIKNATFVGFQASLKYNKDVLQPIGDFEEFATRFEEAEFFNGIGNELDVKRGLFGFTLFVMPGEDAEGINDNGEYVADEEGIKIYSFRFKKIAEGDYSFGISTNSDGEKYEPAFHSGLVMMNFEAELSANITFSQDGQEIDNLKVEPRPEPELEPEPELGPEPGPGPAHVFTSEARKADVICLKIGESKTITFGKPKSIDEANPLVVPYLLNDRTFVPLRFIAENIGAQVLWEDGWNGCLIQKGDKQIQITFDSADVLVNGEKKTYDAPIHVVEGRTMVPVRFVADELDYGVYWNEPNEVVVVYPMDNPWDISREAEQTALNEMVVTLVFKMFG